MTTTALRHGMNREWFVDPRGARRRMQVTCQGDAHRVVLSIWHDNTCTAAFQLPLDEAPRLIAHLADGLSESTHGRLPNTTPTESLPLLDRAHTALERAMSLVRRRSH